MEDFKNVDSNLDQKFEEETGKLEGLVKETGELLEELGKAYDSIDEEKKMKITMAISAVSSFTVLAGELGALAATNSLTTQFNNPRADSMMMMLPVVATAAAPFIFALYRDIKALPEKILKAVEEHNKAQNNG